MKNTKTALAAFFLLYSLLLMGQPAEKEAATGRNLYQAYCLSCHGEEAKGNGPVAQYLTLPPADLTRITIRREGDFPDREIYKIIDGRKEVRVHGTSDMPVWGDAFRREVAPEKADENIRELVAYLKKIQETEKP